MNNGETYKLATLYRYTNFKLKRCTYIGNDSLCIHMIEMIVFNS